MLAMPLMQSDLDILNAEEFDFGVDLARVVGASNSSSSAARQRRGTKRQLSFSLRETGTSPGMREDAVSPENDAEQPPPPGTGKQSSKRIKAAKGNATSPGNDDQEKKRSRGRPRIDAKDVTAADRRRTQIRLAQRAYRNRKENAITTLEKKVKSLIETNEAMSNAFMSLHDYAISHGMLDEHPEFAEHLRRTTETFLELARQSSAEDDDNEEDDDCSGRGASRGGGHETSTTPPTHSNSVHQLMPDDKAGVFGYIHRNMDAIIGVGTDTKTQNEQPQAQQTQQALKSMQELQTHQPPQQLYGGWFPDHGSADDGAGLARQSMIFDALGFPGPSSSSSSGGLGTSLPSSLPFDSTAVPAATTATTEPGGFSNMFVDSTGFSFFSSPALQAADNRGTSNRTSSFPTATTQQLIQSQQNQLAVAAAGSPYASLHLPRAYSSFNLRLRRMALERAYALAIHPNPPPELFARAFGFCIIFDSLETIRNRLRARISRPGSAAATSTWHLPYVSKVLGEHPSTRITGINIDDIASATHKALKLDPDIEIIMPSFAGSFFDAEETEIYLRQRGVEIPPNSDRIIVEVDADDFGGGRNFSGFAANHNNHNHHHNNNDMSSMAAAAAAASGPGFTAATSHMDSFVDVSTPSDWDSGSVHTGTTAATTSSPVSRSPDGKPLAAGRSGAVADNVAGSGTLMSSFLGDSLFGNDGSLAPAPAANGTSDDLLPYSSLTKSSTASGSPTGFSSKPSVSPSHRRVFSMDVNRFVHELVMRGTCLGKYAGFRPADVNEAFWTAVRGAAL